MRILQYAWVVFLVVCMFPLMVVVVLFGKRTVKQMYVDVKQSINDAMEIIL